MNLEKMLGARLGKFWQAICCDIDDLEIVTLNEVRQRQIYDITYMWNLKKIKRYKSTYLKNRVTDVENKFMVTKGKRGRRNKLRDWN